MNCPWLYDGVTTLTRGHGRPSGIVAGTGGLPSVHGQPVRLGGGRACKIEQGKDK